MKITKPMLAESIDVSAGELVLLDYPLIGSPKLDGIRCLKVDGNILSRSFKPIRNKYIRQKLEKWLPEGADGEILSGDTFQACTSAVMTEEGEPKFKFWMFDFVQDSLEIPYKQRLEDMSWWYEKKRRGYGNITKYVRLVPHCFIETLTDLLEYEETCLRGGFEGICLRKPESPYKCGRSTFKQQWLLKLKHFADSEARIVGYVERQHNHNPAYVNELGHTKRSSAKGGKVGADTLGAFKVQDIKTGVEFEIGTGRGLDDRLRKSIWQNQEAYLGRLVKYRYQPIGVKDRPRIGSFIGFRDDSDI